MGRTFRRSNSTDGNRRNYVVINPNNNEPAFQGDYTKYYPDHPYMAIFEEYPSTQTRIWICERLSAPEKQGSNKQLRLLMVRQPDGQLKILGHFIHLSTVQTEQEANDKIQSLIRGDSLLMEILMTGDAK